MKESKDYKNMSNNEIKIEMMNLENLYEATKTQVVNLVNKMKELDSEYILAKKELLNRNRGLWQ